MFYTISGRDSFVDLRSRHQKLAICPTCNIILNPYQQPFLGRSKPKHDLCVTNELMFYASERLKAFLEANCPSPIDFIETSGGGFVLHPARSVYLDLSSDYRGFTDPCPTCGELTGLYAETSKTKLLEGQEPIEPMGLVRSAQRFGTTRQRQCDLIAGEKLVQALKAEKMKGIIYLD